MHVQLYMVDGLKIYTESTVLDSNSRVGLDKSDDLI